MLRAVCAYRFVFDGRIAALANCNSNNNNNNNYYYNNNNDDDNNNNNSCATNNNGPNEPIEARLVGVLERAAERARA